MERCAMTELSGLSVEEKVKAWLLQDAWKVQELPRDAAAVAWALVAEDFHGRKIMFSQQANRPDSFNLHAAILHSEPEMARIAAMEPEKREDFLWAVRFQLLNLAVSFDGVELPYERVSVSRVVRTDDLRERDFAAEVWLVQRAILAVTWLFRRHLGDPPAADEGLPVH
jgi:hypothetical protein